MIATVTSISPFTGLPVEDEFLDIRDVTFVDGVLFLDQNDDEGVLFAPGSWCGVHWRTEQ